MTNGQVCVWFRHFVALSEGVTQLDTARDNMRLVFESALLVVVLVGYSVDQIASTGRCGLYVRWTRNYASS